MQACVTSDALRAVWAKSPAEDGSWLPLWQHMDDAADVAGHLFDQWLAPRVIRSLAQVFEGDCDDARRAVTFLAGIHDLGKATPAFAIQNDHLAQGMRDRGLYMPSHLPDRRVAHHAVAGHHLLIRWLEGQQWSRNRARTWAVIVGGHHGAPPDAQSERLAAPPELPDLYGESSWVAVQNELAERLATRTGAVARLESWRDIKLTPQFQVLATGIVIIADWIASNEDLFPYHSGALPGVVDDPTRAETALSKLRLPSPWRFNDHRVATDELFATRFTLPPGATPRPVQRAAVDVAEEMPDSGLLIIEAAMGEGKTEAALAVAEVMARRWGAGGLFVALPTQATTNAMFARVVAWLDRLGATDQEVGGAITLSHGKARFERLFRGLLAEAKVRDVNSGEDEGDQRQRSTARHSVVAHSWLSGRKTAHLANVAVGTIDQLLFAGLKSRHLMLRHLALAGKVVVIDEIHAYDVYMNSYLTSVLTWLGAYRVPVVALSATLPGDRRRALVDAYQAGRAAGCVGRSIAPSESVDGDIGYPALTWTQNSDAHSRVAAPSGRSTTVELETLNDDLDVLTDVLRRDLADGGCAAVVRNTVKRVHETADALEKAFPGQVTIAHSRFMTADRMAKDTELVDRFGPDGSNRPQRHIVVASQVIEQSLDIDFDLIAIDLAPADLVLQRLGRLHRHQRGENQIDRPPALRVARAYLTGADFETVPPTPESGSARVYDLYVLLRSAGVLLGHAGGTITLPDDIAPLVQAAYREDSDLPPEWQDVVEEAETRWREVTRRRQDKASEFQLNPPGKTGKAIVGWVAANVGETDEAAQGQGQVRDGAPTLEAVIVQTGDNGRWYTPPWLDRDGGREVPTQETPADDLARAMMLCAVRLPLEFSNAQAEKDLWAATPVPWESSNLIYSMPALVIDQSGEGSIAGRRVRYTAQKGLEVFKSDDNDDAVQPAR